MMENMILRRRTLFIGSADAKRKKSSADMINKVLRRKIMFSIIT